MAKTFNERIFGKRVGGAHVRPVYVKIVLIFVLLLSVSNFTSNFINLAMNRGEQIKLLTDLLVRDLKELHEYSNSQVEIAKFSGAKPEDVARSIEGFARSNFKLHRSIALGFASDGQVMLYAEPNSDAPRPARFPDQTVFNKITSQAATGKTEGSVDFEYNGKSYYGIYKYNKSIDAYILRAEEYEEFFEPTAQIFRIVMLIILGLTLVAAVVGAFLLWYILRFVGRMTDEIMRMLDHQSLEMIDLKTAPADDVTYLGMAFNSLSSTINNLLVIFKKFVARDVAEKAYRERQIRLEGNKRDLTILFSDIRNFTTMTETLGNDIINLLNMHYKNAIKCVHDSNGDVGSIIGDALLAIYGVQPRAGENKALEAINSGYGILEVASKLRADMDIRKAQLIKENGRLSDDEERVYDAVSLKVGVGIDGGEVFYGNIGSSDRMVNTVIGDKVNASSRLEGLTKFYQVPMIISESVQTEAERGASPYRFVELDRVLVKGKKQESTKLFYPAPIQELTPGLQNAWSLYSEGLQAYYQGDWKKASKLMQSCSIPTAAIFLGRMESQKAPADWNGVWTMTEK